MVTAKVWFAIICLVAALFAINPLGYFSKGVLVKSIQPNSTVYLEGMRAGEIIQEINDQKINNLEDYINTLAGIFEKNPNGLIAK